MVKITFMTLNLSRIKEKPAKTGITINDCDKEYDKLIETLELDDYLQSLYQDYFLEMRKKHREFTETIDKSFRISCRKRYLQDNLEKTMNQFYEVSHIDEFLIKKEIKKYFSNVPKNIEKEVYHFFNERLLLKKRWLNKKINSYKIELSFLESNQKVPEKFTDEQIEEVSKKDLSFMFDKKKRSGNNFMVNCIFHNEKTPSMFLFKDGHFHCFGCGAHGDSIDLYTKLESCNFKTAVEDLLKIF